jgi:hypothetical protein
MVAGKGPLSQLSGGTRSALVTGSPEADGAGRGLTRPNIKQSNLGIISPKQHHIK